MNQINQWIQSAINWAYTWSRSFLAPQAVSLFQKRVTLPSWSIIGATVLSAATGKIIIAIAAAALLIVPAKNEKPAE
jgi:hypothetical protein